MAQMDFTSPEDALRFERFLHARKDLADRLRVLCSMYRSLHVASHRHRAHWVPDRPHRHRSSQVRGVHNLVPSRVGNPNWE